MVSDQNKIVSFIIIRQAKDVFLSDVKRTVVFYCNELYVCARFILFTYFPCLYIILLGGPQGRVACS